MKETTPLIHPPVLGTGRFLRRTFFQYPAPPGGQRNTAGANLRRLRSDVCASVLCAPLEEAGACLDPRFHALLQRMNFPQRA